ncbi:unnamed protein product [Polarella glacialis]|uniref:Aquaporin n=1 Tax=Polarella glacialis TaxID=89957 RepID=A0A813LI02_POLGL|nr:unnamed protein product [Polarella glacialis]CAE8728686.1 unnamed protein product [Polarella glacialis]|mmetsp:Transcript_13286/g.23767  ORF Transcript_13286/g.23767 Transcript_13286/m.23767 type:complete len:118 (-) Transcript_13286:51-404(-)
MQLAGSIVGALVLWGIFPCEMDMTTTIETNMVGGADPARILSGEAIRTFLLVFTVFLAHVLLPLNGCSINPTRSFGPAIVSKFRNCSNYTPGGMDDLWMFFVGPLGDGSGSPVPICC